MPKILILFAHPALEKSRVHRRLNKRTQQLPGITFHDLYQVYPDMDVDLEYEKKLLLEHDIIIWQHPFYWYSAPAIIKQWLDLVLEHGWAYGKGGTALEGKKIFNVITCGGSKDVYRQGGANRYTIHELLAPFNQTAFLCNMIYLPPFVVYGTHKLTESQIDVHASDFQYLLSGLQTGSIDPHQLHQLQYLNDIVNIKSLQR